MDIKGTITQDKKVNDAELLIQNDGNLVFKVNNKFIWSSDTLEK